MSIHTIDRIIRGRARITPGRVAIVEPGFVGSGDLGTSTEEPALHTVLDLHARPPGIH